MKKIHLHMAIYQDMAQAQAMELAIAMEMDFLVDPEVDPAVVIAMKTDVGPEMAQGGVMVMALALVMDFVGSING